MQNIIWKPQKGSQTLFLTCPAEEILYDGTRGPGKTDALLMLFANQVGKGFGAAWFGIIFRKTYKQLSDIIAKSYKWFPKIFPDAKFNKSSLTWNFRSGESLMFSYMNSIEDYDNYHGWEVPFIGFEELTNWATSECYEAMLSCCRSSTPNMPRKYVSTCNPYGIGHSWVKKRFYDIDPIGGKINKIDGMTRCRIHGTIYENKILLAADPNYINKLNGIKSENKRKAWALGDWDIAAGGAISDYWEETIHQIKPFKIPFRWSITRSFDWGSSKPFSVGYWATSDGSPAIVNDKVVYFPKSSLFRIDEIYGCAAEPNTGLRMTPKKIAQMVFSKDIALAKKHDIPIQVGPADSSIWDDNGDGKSIYHQMLNAVVDGKRCGVAWHQCDKSPGSRRYGLEMFKEMLENTIDFDSGKKSLSCFYCFENCTNFLRIVPSLPQSGIDMDDIDTDSEDHIWDETRYMILNTDYKFYRKEI